MQVQNCKLINEIVIFMITVLVSDPNLATVDFRAKNILFSSNVLSNQLRESIPPKKMIMISVLFPFLKFRWFEVEVQYLTYIIIVCFVE